ncbi:MAG: copper-binding protein [Acidobacteriota bacterium]|nr:copper-binding protein [Acidobacteriota bacterium]
MKKFYLFIFLAVFGFNACQSNQTARSNNARSNNANTTQIVTNVTKDEKQIADVRKKAGNKVAQAKYYSGTGVVTQLNKNTGEVELNHEEIKGKMPAGKNKFQIKYNEFAEVLNVGDKVYFMVEDDSGNVTLSSIFKTS